MITSDGPLGRFVIATPTKCGTTTLEEMARRHAGGRISRGGVWQDDFRIMDWQSPRRQHAMYPPTGWESAARYLVVRSPFARYVSIYEYLRAPHNYSKWGAAEIQGREWQGTKLGRKGVGGPPMSFAQFLTFIADSRVGYGGRHWRRRRGPADNPFHFRSPWVWIDPLTYSVKCLKQGPGGASVPVWPIHLETLWDDLDALVEEWGLDVSTRRTIHANRCLTYGQPVEDYFEGMCGPELQLEGCIGGVELCPSCRVGVRYEAQALGYSTDQRFAGG